MKCLLTNDGEARSCSVESEVRDCHGACEARLLREHEARGRCETHTAQEYIIQKQNMITTEHCDSERKLPTCSKCVHMKTGFEIYGPSIAVYILDQQHTRTMTLGTATATGCLANWILYILVRVLSDFHAFIFRILVSCKGCQAMLHNDA